MEEPGVQALIRRWMDKGRQEGLQAACRALLENKAGSLSVVDLERLGKLGEAELGQLLIDLVAAQDAQDAHAALERTA